ncbi:Aquaporin SIP1-2 [Apostasia shenzhenica]|uniref:Aquaporin SIP1-2 n=1 Tax=Apostasia shenzhenica TaxID=1088818 RepID=A0A2I0A7I1_9ASPA|nr:Aquaporin SIP1-2 [Apostasia shenzhenica]
MGAMRAAISDAVITFLWVFCVSTVGTLTSVIASAVQIQAVAPRLVITTVIIAFLVFVFSLIGEALGGASFNPTGTAAFYAAGISRDSLLSLALRFPAQAAGAVGGVLAIVELMPLQYKYMLGGPSVKVDLHTAAIAEGVLTFLISFSVLWIVINGPRSPIIKSFMVAITTVSLVVAGFKYTGPAMNPANAFGWAYVKNRHNTWEQFYVYWICPFIGAILAALVYRFIFPLTSPKAKKTKKA